MGTEETLNQFDAWREARLKELEQKGKLPDDFEPAEYYSAEDSPPQPQTVEEALANARQLAKARQSILRRLYGQGDIDEGEFFGAGGKV